MNVGKELAWKSGIVMALTGVLTYFNELLIPMLMLLFVMICDYVTGMLSAWVTGTLSSRTGMFGIVKKLCYFFAVCVGGAVDWVLQTALVEVGVELESGFTIGVLILVWLVVNELLSILENLTEIGVPLPNFLKTLVNHLKIKLEEQEEQV